MAKVNIAVLLSRKWRIYETIEQIRRLDTANHIIQLNILIDNSEIESIRIENMLKDLKNKMNIKIENTGNKGTQELNLHVRRERIANAYNHLKKMLERRYELTFIFEDDTNIRSDYMIKLINRYKDLSKRGFLVGIISGIQAGRWGVRMIGAWQCDNPKKPKMLKTVENKPYSKGLEQVDATGLYCLITPTKEFKNNKFIWGDFGTDVYYGLNLRRQRFENFIDWGLHTGHCTQSKIIYPNEANEVIKLRFRNEVWEKEVYKIDV